MRLLALGLVYELVSEELDDLELCILYLLDIHQVGVICDESCVALACCEQRVVQHVQHEGQVGLDSLDGSLS